MNTPKRAPLRWTEVPSDKLSDALIRQAFKYARGVDGFPAVLLVQYQGSEMWRIHLMATFFPDRPEVWRLKEYYRAHGLSRMTLDEAKKVGAEWAQKHKAWT